MAKFQNNLANHLYGVYFGGNWSQQHWFQVLESISLQTALIPFAEMTILGRFCHSHYYLHSIRQVINKQELSTKDSESWHLPQLETEDEYKAFLTKTKQEVLEICELLGKQPEGMQSQFFGKEAYGSFETNVWGIIEHLNYHLGQAVLISKMLNKG